jgi:hypothetical protein
MFTDEKISGNTDLVKKKQEQSVCILSEETLDDISVHSEASPRKSADQSHLYVQPQYSITLQSNLQMRLL